MSTSADRGLNGGGRGRGTGGGSRNLTVAIRKGRRCVKPDTYSVKLDTVAATRGVADWSLPLARGRKMYLCDLLPRGFGL
jgi:hypothetical protein